MILILSYNSPGLPGVIVLISAIAAHDGYGTDMR